MVYSFNSPVPHPNPLSLQVRKAKWKEKSRNKEFTLVCVCVCFFFLCVTGSSLVSIQHHRWQSGSSTGKNQPSLSLSCFARSG